MMKLDLQLLTYLEVSIDLENQVLLLRLSMNNFITQYLPLYYTLTMIALKWKMYEFDFAYIIFQACKGAMRSLAVLFKYDDIKDFLLYQLDENRNLDYVEFLNSLSIELVWFEMLEVNLFSFRLPSSQNVSIIM